MMDKTPDKNIISAIINGGASVTVFPSISSTNDYCRQNATNLKKPAIVIARSQTDGRGRKGRSFYSPDGTGLYMSMLFEFADYYELSLATPAAAVSVCRTIEKLSQVTPKIKWVNDVYVGDRKICGILTETVVGSGGEKYMIVGIGINVTTDIFPEEISSIAGAIGENVDLNTLAAQIYLDFSKAFDSGFDSIVAEYKMRLNMLGCRVTCTSADKCFEATAVDINERCELIVIADSGEKTTLNSGEISVKKVN